MAVLIAAALGVGCTSPPKQLPPRAPPPVELPPFPLPAAAPPPGMGRVVLSGTDGPMNVTAEADRPFLPSGSNLAPSRTGELCVTTPCAIDLPLGRYRLYLTSADGSFKHGDVDDLLVTEGTTYYVRAPGLYRPPEWLRPLPIVLLVAAAAALTTGSVFALSPRAGDHPTGYVLLGGGAALGVWGGIEAYDASRATQQEGATTIWKR